MFLHSIQMTLLGGLLAALAGAGTCQVLPAEPAQTNNAPEATTAAEPVQSDGDAKPRAVPSREVARLGTPAQEARLSRSRGGTDTVSNDATLTATVTNNTATRVVTGSNTIDGGSFANMTGLPMVIQNSGANVLIQSATVINLQLK